MRLDFLIKTYKTAFHLSKADRTDFIYQIKVVHSKKTVL